MKSNNEKLLKKYLNKLSNIKDRIKNLKSEEKKIETIYRNLDKQARFLDDEYDPLMSILDKIKYVLYRAEKPMTSNEIAHEIQRLTKASFDNWSFDNNIKVLIKNVSTVLSMYCNRNEFFIREKIKGMRATFKMKL